jgi:2'-5' RNA ligase
VGADPLEEERPVKPSLRAFFGLPLPEQHRAQLAVYLADCEAVAPRFRWVAEANLHFTMRFIGNVERDVVESIADRLTEARLAGFDLELGELGTFKRGRLVRVAWLALSEGADAAKAIAAQIEAECVRAGLEPEQRQFQPHLTLARARDRAGAALPPLLPPPRLGRWRAGELVLYQSHLSPKGSVYEGLRSVTLE